MAFFWVHLKIENLVSSQKLNINTIKSETEMCMDA